MALRQLDSLGKSKRNAEMIIRPKSPFDPLAMEPISRHGDTSMMRAQTGQALASDERKLHGFAGKRLPFNCISPRPWVQPCIKGQGRFCKYRLPKIRCRNIQIAAPSTIHSAETRRPPATIRGRPTTSGNALYARIREVQVQTLQQPQFQRCGPIASSRSISLPEDLLSAVKRHESSDWLEALHRPDALWPSLSLGTILYGVRTEARLPP